METSFMFKVGKTYKTLSGKEVTVLDRTNIKGYECLICSDGKYRYDRSTHNLDAGRITGSDHDYTHPDNFDRQDKEIELFDKIIEDIDYKNRSAYEALYIMYIYLRKKYTQEMQKMSDEIAELRVLSKDGIRFRFEHTPSKEVIDIACRALSLEPDCQYGHIDWYRAEIDKAIDGKEYKYV